MVATSLIALLALPFAYLSWRTLRHRRVVITHRETFTLGFLWYSGLPMLLASLQLPTSTLPELGAWQSIALLMGPARMATEVVWGVGLWGAFLTGCVIADLGPAPSSAGLSSPTGAAQGWRPILIASGIASLLFGFSWGLLNHSLLFSGYATEYDAVIRGPLQAALVYTSIPAVIAFVRRQQIGRLPLALNGAAMGLEILLSLSVGTRSMSVIASIMLIAIVSRMRGGVPRGVLIATGGVFVGLFSAIAAWRQQSDLTFAAISPALESLYTYISAATYLAFNDIPSWAAPVPLLGSLANLVPRAIWPEKVEFIDALLTNITFFSPLGAMHLFTSLLINFGWLGSIVAVGFSGFAIQKLAQSQRPTSFASYVLIVAVLTTDIWRNPFSQSLIKVVFQGGILIPLLLTLGAAIIALERHGRDAPVAPAL